MSIVTRKFDFGGLELNVVEEGNDISFKGKDVAIALGYKKPQNAIKTHVDDDDKTTRVGLGVSHGHNSQPRFLYINKRGLKRLLLKSRMPLAAELAKEYGIDVHSNKIPYKEQESV